MPFQFTTHAKMKTEQLHSLCQVLDTGLIRWHQQRLITGISENSDLRRLAISGETVLTVVTPENGSGDSETQEN